MAFVTAPDGVRLHYEVVGQGPPLMLHAGSGCDATLWQAAGYVDRLAGTYTCILIDHRGHGASDRPRGWAANTVHRYADDVLAVLDQLQISTYGFWGYSSAIDVGLKLAQDGPDRMRALIGTGAIDTSTRDDDVTWSRDFLPKIRADGWDLMLKGFDSQEIEPVPDWMRERIRATDLQQFVDWVEAIEHVEWHYSHALPVVSVPALFIVGEREDPDDDAARAVALMKRAQRYAVPKAGHIKAFIDPEPALAVALPFLAEHLAPAD